jgi:DNA-binding GntR family transcriptional regulator
VAEWFAAVDGTAPRGLFARPTAIMLTLPGYQVQAWAEHTGIAARILVGDGAEAERLAREHGLAAGRITQE